MEQDSPLDYIKMLENHNQHDVRRILAMQMERDELKSDIRYLQRILRRELKLKETFIQSYLQKERQRIGAIAYLVQWKPQQPEDIIRLEVLNIRFACLQDTKCYTMMPPNALFLKNYVMQELKTFMKFPALCPSIVVSMKNFYPKGKKQLMD